MADEVMATVNRFPNLRRAPKALFQGAMSLGASSQTRTTWDTFSLGVSRGAGETYELVIDRAEAQRLADFLLDHLEKRL